VSGPGRGYSVDPEATSYLLAGDESAIPAIGQLVEALPAPARVAVIVEVAHPDARSPITERPDVDVRWVDRPTESAPGAALVPAVVASEITPDTRVWAAGEAAAVQRIRRHLFTVLGIPRAHANVRGYWKHGRSGGDED
jgi:NADPH-dependent ferric siderophore reductase